MVVFADITPLPALATGSLPAQIHRALEESIISGRLAPDVRLRADDLASVYGVSRIPVREALSSLHEAGWVDMRPRYGVFVRARTRAELSELFEARAGIESELARLAAQRATPAHLQHLDDISAQSDAAASGGDVEALSDAAVRFNAQLRQASGNDVLSQLSLTLEKRARFYFSPVAHLLGSEWAEGQRRLVSLLRAHDIEPAGLSARRHITETGEAVSRLLPEDSFSGRSFVERD